MLLLLLLLLLLLRLWANRWCGATARPSEANCMAWLNVGLPVSIQMQSAYGVKAMARWVYHSVKSLNLK